MGPSPSMLATKKPKPLSQTFAPLGRSGLEPERRGSPAPHYSLAQPQLMAFEEAAIDVEPQELLSKVLIASKEGDEERMEGLLCGAVKHLRNNRSKPDQTIYLTLMYLAKTKSSLFLSDLSTEAFCSVLKRDVSLSFKAKGNSLVSVLACNVLMAAFGAEESWPDNFVKVYIDDLLGERVWVDREDCKCFVENIYTAFPTRASPKHLLASNDPSLSAGPGGASPLQSLFEDEETSKCSDGGDLDKISIGILGSVDIPISPRYPYQQMSIQVYVLDLVREQVAKRQPMDASCRNLIRLMTVTAGYGEIRTMSVQRLEMWLQNPKLQKAAQDLLLAVCVNCTQNDQTDQEVIQQLLKIRIKSKPLQNHYLNCIREMLGQHTENVRLLVKSCVLNEFMATRNPNNLMLVSIAFSHSPELASKILAEVLQDMLASPDLNYIRLTRGLLRELVRYVRQDIDFTVFCRTLTQERQDPRFADLEATLKERFVMNTADLISLSILLCITPAIKEAVPQKDMEVLSKFWNQVAIIMRDAMFWVQTVIPKIVDLKGKEFVHCIRKVLFLENMEHYYNKDNWPPENERNYMFYMVTEVPVLEDTIIRVLVMGLSRGDLHHADCMDIVDNLVRRAAPLHLKGFPVLHMENLEVFNLIFNLSKYRYPENTQMPKGYAPPSLAISISYWKAWIVLLILSAFNPTTFGKEAWDKYPMLKCLMEMAMINRIVFPPPSSATDEKMVEEILNAERQSVQLEMQKILEFESILASGTITQESSLLLPQVTTLDPLGTARCPPPNVMEMLVVLNRDIKIGQLLSDCRDPGFLDDVIQHQDDSKSLPWLAELVESDERSLDRLPVACVCEFLLHDPRDALVTALGDDETCRMDKQALKLRLRKHRQLLGQMQQLVHSSSDTGGKMFEVISYFLQRLHSTQANARVQAMKGLSMVISNRDSNEWDKMDLDNSSGQNNHDWLLKDMPELPTFHHIQEPVCESLRQACLVESDPTLINSYIIFLSLHAMDQSLQALDLLVLDISQLIVERNSVLNHILPDMESQRRAEYEHSLEAFLRLFQSYLAKARCKEKDYSWSNTQDQILLQWKSGESATMYILSVHAMVIILSYGQPRDGEARDMYRKLLDIWFPVGEPMPSAFLMDTSEEALLLPDWLKLRMIRSSEQRLVTAALTDLDPRQLLLFVQSFGIPVDSMSYLLSHLDKAAVDQPTELLEMVSVMMTDPNYISTLIEIQRMRGATAGDKFHGLLTKGDKIPASVVPEKMEVNGQATSRSWQVLQPVKSEHSSSAASLAKDFFKLFSLDIKPMDASKLFQHLLKVVYGDKTKAASLVNSVAKRLDSNQGQDLAQQMLNNPSRSCPLLRIFFSLQDLQLSVFIPALQAILDAAGPDSTSSLVALVSKFLHTHTKHRPISRKRQASIDLDSLKSHGKVHPQAFIEGVKGIGDSKRLEPLVKQYMQESVQHQASHEGIFVACSLLQHTTTQSSMNTPSQSLLTDWLELMDPEIVSANLDLQEQLVFGSGAVPTAATETGEKKKGGNPYLLALLTHQSQWGTIHRCLNRILSPSKLATLNPTSVLDFVWACRHIPKIWQGRELKSVKTDRTEDLFAFNNEQLMAVVDFIVLEASQSQERILTTSSKVSSSLGEAVRKTGEAGEEEVGCRLKLLLTCVCDSDERLKVIVSHILTKLSSSPPERPEEQCYLELLQELYLHFPYIMAWIPPAGPLSADWMVSEQIHSHLDTVTQRLLSVLGKAGPGNPSHNRMCDANLACRKLAARHPRLILRQLPLLAAVLGGRTQLTIGEMRHRNLLLLFTYVLGILELLQPHVFHKQHTALSAILQAYFSLFKAHAKETRLLGSLVNKMVIILQNFVTYDPQRASSMLQQYVQLLGDLTVVYPDMTELKSLLTGLTLPRQNQNETAEEGTSDEPLGSGTIRPQSSGLAFAQIQPFVKRLSVGASTEDLIQVLKDLDETSKRRVSVLDHFENELQRLMTHVSPHCRSLVFTLIMRYIHYSPRKAQSFLPSFLTCLQHHSPEVVSSALKNFAEFIFFCQDETPTLLQRAFDISITTTMDSSDTIKEALQLLNMQSVMDMS